VSPAQAARAPEPERRGLTRWLDLQAVTLSTRFRFIQTSAGVTAVRQQQHKESLRARLTFDKAGAYSLNAGVFSGKSFISSWDATGLGTGDPQGYVAVKQLFLAARPIRGLELQYGGLYLVRGESSEITTYDEDGFIVGGRASVRRPDAVFFDEISLTVAHLGDPATPNVFKRLRRLSDVNYRHVLLGKRIGGQVAVTLDYTYENGRETIREAVSLRTSRVRVVDLVRLENYQRVTGQPALGFTLSGEKTIRTRVTAGAGYACIDRDYGGLNGDRYQIGNRLFVSSSVPLRAGFTLQGYLTRAVGNDDTVPQGTRVDVVLGYNLLTTLQRSPLFRPAGFPAAPSVPGGTSGRPSSSPPRSVR
jgi:hypothetical protein